MSTNTNTIDISQTPSQTPPQTPPQTLSREPTLQFLSLQEEDISQEKIIAEVIPAINHLILEMYGIKKKIKTDKFDNATDKSETNKKLRLFADICAVYKNPAYIRMIKDAQEAQEAQEERARLQKLRNEAEARRRESLRTFESGTSLLDFFNNGNKFSQLREPKSPESDVDSKKSDMTDNDLDNEEFDKMISESYAGIKKNSMVFKMTGVKRFNHGYLDSSDEDKDNDETNSTEKSDESKDSENTWGTNNEIKVNDAETNEETIISTNTDTNTNTNINTNTNTNTENNTSISINITT